MPFVAPEPYVWVFPTPRPSFDPLTQFVREAAPALSPLGNYEQRWEVVDLSGQQLSQSLQKFKGDAVLQVDRDVDAIYAAALGNRGPEYADAEMEALEFKAAGYSGTAPASVQSWATAKGWTATQATNDILAAAAQLRGAKQAIRAQRLLRKEQVKAAATAADARAAMAAWAVFVAAIKAQLGL